jgi:hypothetical protein
MHGMIAEWAKVQAQPRTAALDLAALIVKDAWLKGDRLAHQHVADTAMMLANTDALARQRGAAH